MSILDYLSPQDKRLLQFLEDSNSSGRTIGEVEDTAFETGLKHSPQEVAEVLDHLRQARTKPKVGLLEKIIMDATIAGFDRAAAPYKDRVLTSKGIGILHE